MRGSTERWGVIILGILIVESLSQGVARTCFHINGVNVHVSTAHHAIIIIAAFCTFLFYLNILVKLSNVCTDKT